MIRCRHRAGFLLLLAIAAVSPATTGRASPNYQLIVHPENPTREVPRLFLRDAFLKRAVQWSHGATLRPVDLAARAAARESFSRDILGRGVPEVKRYWQQQIFSGKGVPPPEMDSEAEVIAYVLKHPGAVGYLTPGTDSRGARVLAVK